MEIAGVDLRGLPSVLAIPLAEYAREDDPLLRLWHLCDVTELTLRTFAALALADQVAGGRGRLPKALVPEVASRIEQPTFGKWRGLVLALTAKPAADSRLPELAPSAAAIDACIRGDGGVEGSILELRNRLAHGGGMSRAMAGKLLDGHRGRFEALVAELDWLRSLSFAVPDRRGLTVGPTTELAPAADDVVDAAARRVGGAAGAVAAVRDGDALGLWPLLSYGVPEAAGLGRPATRPVPLVYARRGEVRLMLTPLGSDEVAMAESDPSAVDLLVELCKAPDDAKKKESWQVPGFESELRRDAAHLVGRTDELARITEAAEARETGVLWITGPAGIGKSYLMAAAARALGTEPTPERLVLPYRFKLGDPRTSRDAFLRFAVERIGAWQGSGPPNPRRALDKQLAEQLAGLEGGRVIVVLDGLDELAAVDPSFAEEVPLALADRALWICAGRAERGLDRAFAGADPLFPGGLPGLGSGDVRAMLLAKIGPLSKRLLRGERDDAGEVVSPFVDRVVAAASGLPLYVAYVIGDILGGRLTELDGDAPLPPSLDAYHGELLRGCAVGSVHQLLTPMMCALALAEEPWTAATLHRLLIRRGLVTADDAGAAEVDRALAGAASMLRRSPDDGGDPAFVLFHASLRDHMRAAPELAVAMATASAALAAAAADLRADARLRDHAPTAHYLFEHGAAHLCAAGRAATAADQLTDVGYLIDRLSAGGTVGAIAGDLDRVGELLASDAPAAVARWAGFLRRTAHLVARGGPTALIQAAVAEADQSPITLAAEAWLAGADPGRPWLRRLDRPDRPIPNPCLATFEGHQRRVTDLAVDRARGLVVSSGGDAALRLWEIASGVCLRTLEERQETLSFAVVTTMPVASCLRALDGHGWTVWSVALIDDRRAVAAHGDRTIKIWDLDSGAVDRTLKGHDGYIWSVDARGDRIASAGDDRVIRLWSAERGELTGELRGHDDWIARAILLPDDRGLVSAGGDRAIRLWDLETGSCVRVLGGHTDYVAGLAVAADGRTLFSGSGDGTVARWDLSTGQCVARWPAHPGGVWSVAAVDDGLLSAGRDGLVHLWDPDRGSKLRTLRGHAGWVWRVADAGDGRVLTASGDRTVKLWDLAAAASAQGRPSHDGPIRGLVATAAGAASCAADGTIKLWDPAGGRSLRTVDAHDGDARGLARIGDQLVSIGADRELSMWSAADGSASGSRALEVDPVSVAAGGDRIAVGAADGAVLVGGITGELSVVGRHAGAAAALAVAPDGERAASGGADGLILLWDLVRGERLRELRGHTWEVQAIRFTADGRYLVSAGRDQAVMIWDLRTGRCSATRARHRGDAGALAVTADGRVLSATDGKTVDLWTIDGDDTVASWPGDAATTAIAVDGAGNILIGDVAGALTCLALQTGSNQQSGPVDG